MTEQTVNMKRIYQCNRAGELIGYGWADESPLEPGVFHIPAYATDIAPPEYENKIARFDFDAQTWGLEDVPPAPPRIPTVTKAQFTMALLLTGRITPLQKTAWLDHDVLPIELREQFINNLTVQGQADAAAAFTASTCQRDEWPFTELVGVYAMDAEQLDAIFHYASTR